MNILKNNDIYNLAVKFDTVSPNSLSTLGQENQSALNILSSRLSGVLNGLDESRWDCSVRTAIQGYVDGPFKNSIDNAIKSSQFVSDSIVPVTNLINACKEYVDLYDSYEEEFKRTVRQYEEIVDETTNEVRQRETQEYIEWRSAISAYENTIPEAEREVLRIKESVKNYFDSIDFETNTQNSDIYSLEATEIKFSFVDYFNNQYAVIKEEYEVKNQEVVKDPGTDIITTTTEYKVEREYVDGAVGSGEGTEIIKVDDLNQNDVLDEGEPYVCNTSESGTIETVDGEKYDYDFNSEVDQYGLVHEDVTVVEQESEEVVYEGQEDRTVLYQDSLEIVNVEYMQEEKTDTEETKAITRSYALGEEVKTEQLVFSVNKEDTTCGVVSEENGEKYTYYRDTDGILHETCETGDGSVSEDTVDEDEMSICVFTVTNSSTGESISYDVNVYSRLDRAKMLYDVNAARRECGYNDESGSFLTTIEVTNKAELEGPNGEKYIFTYNLK